MKRDILNHLGAKIGEMELPDGTAEEVWEKKLAMYAMPPASSDVLMMNIQRRRVYCEDLIERLKKKNIIDRINPLQAVWMHHKMRALPVSYMGLDMVIDIMNLVISGDVEVAVISLLHSTPDDMSEPYHWFSQDRIDWIVADMKSFLGWA